MSSIQTLTDNACYLCIRIQARNALPVNLKFRDVRGQLYSSMDDLSMRGTLTAQAALYQIIPPIGMGCFLEYNSRKYRHT